MSNAAGTHEVLAVLAIDGPSGSGKSTIAREVAKRLGLSYLDTGAMYRAVASLALSLGVAADDEPGLVEMVKDLEVEVEGSGPGQVVVAGGKDVSDLIRTPEVTEAASKVATVSLVRERLVELQRRWARNEGGGVIEGRDIGSVVFPDARLKIYLTADPSVRAERRSEETGSDGGPATLDAILERDHRDRSRGDSPLVEAPGAVRIDTSALDIEEVTNAIVGLWNKMD